MKTRPPYLGDWVWCFTFIIKRETGWSVTSACDQADAALQRHIKRTKTKKRK